MHRSRRVAAVVLARTGSTRLPKKMLLPFGEGTVLSTVIERLRACETIDELVLATTDEPADDALAQAGEEAGLQVVRGPVDDVVDRMTQAIAALEVQPEVIVRACADNPLVMPTVVDAGVRELIESGADIATPFEYATLPFGYGLVSMTRACLARIDDGAQDPAYREHVENFCFEHPGDFRVHYQVAPTDLTCPELCLTLDFQSDYQRLLAAQRKLDGVALADQPLHLIRELRAAKVWVEGMSSGSPSDADLVLATRALENLRPSLGQVVVETARHDGTERFVLRYADPKRPGFTSAPLFVDRRVRRSTDTPHSFLSYAAPLAAPALLGAPARGIDLVAAFAAHAEKHVATKNRSGFRRPSDAFFPPRIALAPDLSLDDSSVNGVLTELSFRDDVVVLLDPTDSEARAQLIAKRLGIGRVLRARPKGDPFSTVVLQAPGLLSVGAEAVDYRRSSVESFWLSSQVRRARAQALNGLAA